MKRTLFAIVAMAVVLGASGCGDDETSGGSGGGDGQPQAKAITKLRIGGADPKVAPTLGALQVAEQHGWWKEAGLEVEILPGVGGGNVTQALVTGSTDIAIASPATTVNAAIKSSGQFKLIGGYYPYNQFVWMTFDENATVNGSTLAYTAAGSLGALIVETYAKANPDLDIKGQAAGGLGDMLAAAKSGRITAMLNLPPFSYQVEEEGAKVMLTGRDMVGDIPNNFVAVRSEYAEQNGDALRAFWEVVAKAFTYFIDDPEAAATDLAKFMPVDRKYILKALQGDNRDGYTIKTDDKTLENLGRVLLDGGVVDEPVDWSAILDQQYLPEAARADLSAIGS